MQQLITAWQTVLLLLQISLLTRLGFEWESKHNHHRWMTQFELLQKFVRSTGHTSVPRDLDTNEFPRLGSWVALQRRTLRNLPADSNDSVAESASSHDSQSGAGDGTVDGSDAITASDGRIDLAARRRMLESIGFTFDRVCCVAILR